MDKKLMRLSKFLSLVLRHKPQQIGLTLDSAGWASVTDLLAKANAASLHPVSSGSRF
ncbi:MAG: RNA 2'-phosphotransferase [Ardenticatenaceae bacterium]|nr:RNA 2'-phosphotransferase [Ardenticatenaceae bacterium]